MITHEENWIALAEILGPRSPMLKPLISRFGSPEGVFSATVEELRAALPDITELLLTALVQRRTAKEATRLYTYCYRNGVRVLTYDSEEYPAVLRDIDEPPAVLYCRGKLPPLDKRLAVSVVGTRKADAYGEQVTYRLSFEMAAAGTVIVSGMAAGADAIASAAALNAGGEAVAVLGCGIDLVYPKQHTRLAREIAEHGAVITEFAPGTPPNGWNFPIRNRIISALSSAVLVTEADERSGALITARYGVLQGKTIFAVPGDITAARSAGCNRLLFDGAIPALRAEDILSYFHFLYRDALHPEVLPEAMQYSALTSEALRPYGLRMVKAETPSNAEAVKEKKVRNDKKVKTVTKNEDAEQKSAPDTSALTPRQRELYMLLPDTPFSVDILTGKGVPVSEAASTLTVFEIYGLIGSRPGGVFEKK